MSGQVTGEKTTGLKGMYTIVIWGTLFSGAGGVDEGLQQAGHTIAWGVEIEPAIADCYRANHPTSHLICADLQDVDPRSLSAVQGLWTSPTCKQHSQARNKSLPPRDDADIGLAILPYIEALKPEIVIIENVKQYEKHPSLSEIILQLLKWKYSVSMRVLDAANYGVPQQRERLIVQARRGPIAWPDYAPKRVTWYEALKDMLDDLEPSDLAGWQRKHWKAEYDALVPLMVHSQYDYRTENEPWQLYIIPSNRPSMTVTASHNSTQCRVVLANENIRRMTIQASARLQTFPDSYQWPATKKVACEAIGNAVPPLLVKQLTKPYASVQTEKAAS